MLLYAKSVEYSDLAGCQLSWVFFFFLAFTSKRAHQTQSVFMGKFFISVECTRYMLSCVRKKKSQTQLCSAGRWWFGRAFSQNSFEQC